MAEGTGNIVIKKVKKGGHGGGHGGAWKVAYADFVTAMMAFFLLMWLLNATEAENLAGLADYFAPTVGVKGEMGIGFRGGKSALSKGIGADINTNKGIIFGGTPSGPVVKVHEKLEQETMEEESEKIELILGSSGEKEEQNNNASEAEQAMAQYIDDIAKETGFQDSIDVTHTIEGLQIQFKDTEKEPMFEKGTVELRANIQVALRALAGVLETLPNYISITGHTGSELTSGKVNYGNWELSADRANTTRRFLVSYGVQPEQVAKIVARSDNDPLDPNLPNLPANNRISIVLLRDAVMPQHKKGAPEGVFVDTESEEVQELLEEEIEEEVVKETPLVADEAVREAIEDIINGEEEEEESESDSESGDASGSGAVPDSSEVNEETSPLPDNVF